MISTTRLPRVHRRPRGPRATSDYATHDDALVDPSAQTGRTSCTFILDLRNMNLLFSFYFGRRGMAQQEQGEDMLLLTRTFSCSLGPCAHRDE